LSIQGPKKSIKNRLVSNISITKWLDSVKSL
jgi:hypothetical protein